MSKLPNGWSYESINSIVEGGMIADGDWVESCTALVEHTDGLWEIINWTTSTDVDIEYYWPIRCSVRRFPLNWYTIGKSKRQKVRRNQDHPP